ncbi:MAG TPA: hypothetical protein DIW54_00620, partial [Chitinophagaceae bacterium]|nr:hypothetical protein [Chitinophagaceae bacterium]
MQFNEKISQYRLIFSNTLLILFTLLGAASYAQTQQLQMKEFVIYSAKELKLNDKVTIKPDTTTMGSIGSRETISLKKGSSITANIFGRSSIDLDKELSINGNITANNYQNNKSDILKGDKSVSITGNLLINGNIKLSSSGSSINGSVKQSTGTTYSGPTPTGGISRSNLVLPIFPTLPVINQYEAGSGSINSSITLSPGNYGTVTLNSGQTLTLNGTGTYVFKSIISKGSGRVNIVYNFNNSPTGHIRIFVTDRIQLKNINASVINGGSAKRIFTEVHSNKTSNSDEDDEENAFFLSNETSNIGTIWLGTVWVPYGKIKIKSAEKGPTTRFIGALWCGNKIIIEKNIEIVYAPLKFDPNNISPYYPPPEAGKTTNLIGAELTQLSTNVGPITSIPANNIFTIDSTNVAIEAIAIAGQEAALLAY